MVEFRKEFPLEELTALVAHFRGEKKLPFPTLLSNLFEVVSYGLGQVLPKPENKKFYTGWNVEATTPEDLADALESTLPATVKSQVVGEPGTVKAVVPWEMLIPVLANMISGLLLKYLKGETN